MAKKQITNSPHQFKFELFPAKIKCTYRRNQLETKDFVITPSGDYTYSEEYTYNGCKVTTNIRVNGKYPNRLYNADYPRDISINGNFALWGFRLAVAIPIKKLNVTDASATRIEEISFTNKDISISAIFEITNERLIEAQTLKVKN